MRTCVSLANIVKHWPPAPGPDQPETGHMTVTKRFTAPHVDISLGSLHTPAWWTGVNVSSAARVRLTVKGVPVFSPTDSWMDVSSGVCLPFMWPIPAQVATDMNLVLEVDVLSSDIYVTVRVMFHEMPEVLLDARSQLCFLENENNIEPSVCWNLTPGPECSEWNKVYVSPLRTALQKK